MANKISHIRNKYKKLKDHEFFYKNGFIKFEYSNNTHFENLKKGVKL